MLLTAVSSYLMMHWLPQNPRLEKEQIRYKDFPEAAIWCVDLPLKFENFPLHGPYLKIHPVYLQFVQTEPELAAQATHNAVRSILGIVRISWAFQAGKKPVLIIDFFPSQKQQPQSFQNVDLGKSQDYDRTPAQLAPLRAHL